MTIAFVALIPAVVSIRCLPGHSSRASHLAGNPDHLSQERPDRHVAGGRVLLALDPVGPPRHGTVWPCWRPRQPPADRPHGLAAAPACSPSAITTAALAGFRALADRRVQFGLRRGGTRWSTLVAMGLARPRPEDLASLTPCTSMRASIFDPAGTGTYINAESGDPGGQQPFRLIWWRDVIEDTMAINPMLRTRVRGDLVDALPGRLRPADRRDVRRPESPQHDRDHVRKRMGVIGLAAWIAVSAGVALLAWRLLRSG